MAEEARAAAINERAAARTPAAEQPEADAENATLYGLLRLRFNDNPNAPTSTFPELDKSALIRELHVYGALVAARPGESKKGSDDDRPQHVGIGKTLMGTAELIAASQGWGRISVIAGVGVRDYYRRLGYQLRGDGQYLVKELRPVLSSHEAPMSFETSFLEAATRVGAVE